MKLKGQLPIGLITLKAGVDKDNETITKECVQMVRDKVGPVAAFKTAIVVKRLPKTRSGKILRGTGLGKTMVDPLTGQVPRSAALFSRNMWGHLQGKIPSGWANKAFGLPNAAIMKAIKKSPATKFFSRFLPGANVAMGATSAADYAKKGQYVRAGLAGLSMIPGPFGWAGLAGEAAVNVGESIMNKRTGETGGGGGKDEGPSEAQQRFERSGADTNRSFTQTDYGKAYRRGGIASLWQR